MGTGALGHQAVLRSREVGNTQSGRFCPQADGPFQLGLTGLSKSRGPSPFLQPSSGLSGGSCGPGRTRPREARDPFRTGRDSEPVARIGSQEAEENSGVVPPMSAPNVSPSRKNLFPALRGAFRPVDSRVRRTTLSLVEGNIVASGERNPVLLLQLWICRDQRIPQTMSAIRFGRNSGS